MALNTELAAAGAFLAPVLRGGTGQPGELNASISQRLRGDVEHLECKNNNSKVRSEVISEALDHLSRIYDLRRVPSAADLLYDPSNRRIIDGLADLILLEGIYPCLSPGTGLEIERRIKSNLVREMIKRNVPQEQRDESLLARIISTVQPMVQETGSPLAHILRERILADVIAGAGELAFGLRSSDEGSNAKYVESFKQLLIETPNSALLPTLTSLLRPTSPEWFRNQISATLAGFPMRPGGVRETIKFIAITSDRVIQGPDNSSNQNNQSMPQGSSIAGPTFSMESLGQASKLLASVPRSVDAKDYFIAIVPQLLELLDEKETTYCSAAAYVISIGILGRKTYGAPGSLGWELLVKDIFQSLNPPDNSPRDEYGSRIVDYTFGEPAIIVRQSALENALDRLNALITIHPNPGLTKRLVSPLLLPLWGLYCYSLKSKNQYWSSRVSEILSVYFKAVGSVDTLSSYAKHLLWDGEQSWTYYGKDKGDTELRQRQCLIPNMMQIMKNIDKRIEYYTELLELDDVSDEALLTVFLNITRSWLLKGSRPGESPEKPIGENHMDAAIRTLAFAKLVQSMLGNFSIVFVMNPERIIQLAKEILDGFVRLQKEVPAKGNNTLRPSIASLGYIVDSPAEASGTSQSRNNELNGDPTEIASTALSLLSVILLSPDFRPDASTSDLLSTLQPSLKYVRLDFSIDGSLRVAATKISTLVGLHTSLDHYPSSASAANSGLEDRFLEDYKTHTAALSQLTESVPPIRAQGLALLTSLISPKSSPTLDVPSTTFLLLSILQDEEEYIYLNAIKTLSLLAEQHLNFVAQTLVETYVDAEEQRTLDDRLRIGEALARIVETMRGPLVGDVIQHVIEGMIAVAGRRGKRQKKVRPKDQESLHEGEDVDQEDAETRLAAVLEGWQGRDGEDDTRIRASALSILGLAIEANFQELSWVTLLTVVDLAIAILKIETSSEKAIVRRAAAALMLSLVESLDKTNEKGIKTGSGLAGENLDEMIETFRYIEGTDRDDIVIGHVQAVIESLANCRSNKILDISRLGLVAMNSDLGLAGSKIAGLSLNADASEKPRPYIQELE